jgi:hypothetical protein
LSTSSARIVPAYASERSTVHGDRRPTPESDDEPYARRALDNGEDIGHYGRLVFAMIGRHFVTNDELVELLTKDHDADEGEIRALVKQVEEKGYSPPRREKILEYQSQQDFPICPDPDDPDACNPYAELQFPDEVYEAIQEYREERT